MRSIGREVGAVALAFVVAAEARGQDDAAAAGAAFDAAYQVFARAYSEGDPAAVTGLYAEDAFYLAPGDSITRGDVGQHFGWLSQFEAGKGPVVDFEIVDRLVEGDLATDIGYYRIRGANEPEGTGDRGKFIVIWKREQSGAWKIHADGYSGVSGSEEGP
jgi:ketosteroid isomerase-like protein